MKICNKCRERKELSEFGKKKNGLQPWCKICNTAYQAKWYAKNREKHIKGSALSRQQYYKKVRSWFFEYFLDKCCVDCGCKDYRVFQFDHVTGEKFTEVSEMIHRGFALSKLKEEVEKCVIRCANCHMIKTGMDHNWWWSRNDNMGL